MVPSVQAESPDMAASLVPLRFRSPNLSDFYAQGVTYHLRGQSRATGWTAARATRPSACSGVDGARAVLARLGSIPSSTTLNAPWRSVYSSIECRRTWY